MNFNPVTQRHDRVIVVGGGASLEGFDFHRLDDFKGAIITVNKVISFIPRADYWVTIDMAWDWDYIPNKYADTGCFAGVPALKDRQCSVHLLQRVPYFTDNPTRIIGVNSGLAAVNLAYHFKASRVLMLGIDYCGVGHFYDIGMAEKGMIPYDAGLKKIQDMYRSSLPVLKQGKTHVANGSIISAVTCYPKLDIEKGLKWVQG